MSPPGPLWYWLAAAAVVVGGAYRIGGEDMAVRAAVAYGVVSAIISTWWSGE